MNTVFIHPERCIGCKQCEAACAVAHSQTNSLFWAVFETPTPKSRIHAEPGVYLNTAFPNKCRHCNPAPCQIVCPTSAIQRTADMPDIVQVEARKCIACAMCALVCPFDVITYHASAAAPEKGQVAIKCDQCLERQRQDLVPACVEACKVGALEFGELNELLRKARLRYSERTLSAVGPAQPPLETPELPLSIEMWRNWGVAVSHLNADGGDDDRQKGA
jgi:carbon-monoxide dehydrogenase iron sulfur subunit